ncbi:hypothetical protein TUM17377_17450 [Shewanella chilikensis]|nr:hypothetical protein TUM17377_17450 [Shewanella chilikensis]
MNYKQLIEGQRYQIEAYLREGFSYREIGKRLKVSHSTISREVNRNRIRDNHKNTGLRIQDSHIFLKANTGQPILFDVSLSLD